MQNSRCFAVGNSKSFPSARVSSDAGRLEIKKETVYRMELIKPKVLESEVFFLKKVHLIMNRKNENRIGRSPFTDFLRELEVVQGQLRLPLPIS